MKRSTLLSLIASLALTLTSSTIQAQQIQQPDVPRTISYQGLLTSSNGAPLPDGTYDITVSLFLDEAGTQPLWNTTFNTDVRNGLFNILLGNDRHPLPAPLQMNRPLWVGTAVNGSPIMRPLSPLTASPYALNLPDRTVTTAKLADGAVTAEKMGTPYVAGIALNGKTITADGSVLNIEVGEGIALTYDEETRTLKLSKTAAAVQGDEEKGAEVLDYVSGTENWIGRQNGDGTTRSDPPIIRGTSYNTIAGGFNTLIDTLSDFSGIVGGYENTIDTAADYSFIGGGSENSITSNYATVSGGRENGVTGTEATIGGGAGNAATAIRSTVAGGYINAARSSYATVGGGRWNNADADYGTIGGGDSNIVLGNVGTIGGGWNNIIRPSGEYNTIGGGYTNIIRDQSYYATIGGGVDNVIDTNANSTVISGGSNNYIGIVSHASTVGGGTFNAVGYDARYNVIAGGEWNAINDGTYHSAIGGGSYNTIETDIEHGTIGGGYRNLIDSNADYTFIGGGSGNSIYDDWGTIAGGDSNIVGALGIYSFIGSGRQNRAESPYDVIGGGELNMVESSYSVIGGGARNSMEGNGQSHVIGGGEDNEINYGSYYGVIGGGVHNVIDSSVSYGTIGGGLFNVIENTANFSTIGGGLFNLVDANARYNFIGGGELNKVHTGSYHSTIAGGEENEISSNLEYASIGGGYGNVLNGDYTTIPGGDQLTTNASYAQTAVGFYNAPRGTVGNRPAKASLTNDPLFMVGNGDVNAATRSNAFEVSYNGHSVVYDRNTSGTARSAIRGATYTDNVIYAWGIATPNQGMVNFCDFGVASILYLGVGHYRVILNPVKPDGSSMNLGCGSVTATITTPNRECAYINTSALSGNQFDVFISEPGLVTTMSGGFVTSVGLLCNPIDLPFSFKVTARPPAN